VVVIAEQHPRDKRELEAIAAESEALEKVLAIFIR